MCCQFRDLKKVFHNQIKLRKVYTIYYIIGKNEKLCVEAYNNKIIVKFNYKINFSTIIQGKKIGGKNTVCTIYLF